MLGQALDLALQRKSMRTRRQKRQRGIGYGTNVAVQCFLSKFPTFAVSLASNVSHLAEGVVVPAVLDEVSFLNELNQAGPNGCFWGRTLSAAHGYPGFSGEMG